MHPVQVRYCNDSVEITVGGGAIGTTNGGVNSSGAYSTGGGISFGDFEDLVAAVTSGLVRGAGRGASVGHDGGALGVLFGKTASRGVGDSGVSTTRLGAGIASRSVGYLGDVEGVEVVRGDSEQSSGGGSESSADAVRDTVGERQGAECDSGVFVSVGTVGLEAAEQTSTTVSGTAVVSEKTLQNRAKRHAKAAAKRARREAFQRGGRTPVWCSGASDVPPVWRAKACPLPSLSGSAKTVDTRTACEIEAADTLARRRVVENEIAIAKGKHALASLANKDKTEALMRLDVARVEERINTTKARSQASYKKCGSPLESVGSAASAGEFAWKQQVRKQEALQAEVDSLGKQLDKLLTIATPAQFNMLARLELPHIPTDEEIAAMDEDCSPYYTREEAEAEAAAYGVF